MNTLEERKNLIATIAQSMGREISEENDSSKDTTPRTDLQQNKTKLCTLEEAIQRSGLKDGMTISFHHHFRGGDKVVNMVVDKLAEMGFKGLHLAASSLSDVHAPLIEHIKAGVIAVNGKMVDRPVVIRAERTIALAIASGVLTKEEAAL